MPSVKEEQQPPSVPDIKRRLSLDPLQLAGVSALLLLPVLAVFGVFGEAHESARAETNELSVEMQYPSRFRHTTNSSIHLNVTNRTAAMLDTVSIDVDTALLSRFSNVVAIPDFERPYLLKVTHLEPGEIRQVRVEIKGESFGRHRGEVRVTDGGRDTARVQASIFIFP